MCSSDLYPCCRHYHAVIDGIKQLQREHRFKADDVEHALLGIYAVGVNGHDYKHCETLLDAQMSAPVAAAMAILLGDVTATMFVPETLDRADLRALIERIDAKLDDECERIYPGIRSGAAKITLKSGKVLEARVLEPKGEVKNPMTDADLAQMCLNRKVSPLGMTETELLHAAKNTYTIVMVTHHLQQAARVSDQTAFFWMGTLVEHAPSSELFTNPREARTEAYITGRFG